MEWNNLHTLDLPNMKLYSFAFPLVNFKFNCAYVDLDQVLILSTENKFKEQTNDFVAIASL